jgi:transcriptional regulator with XRE-family HTH domain
MTIAERIRLTRQQRKMSQTETCGIVWHQPKSLSRYELAQVWAAGQWPLKDIADALQVSTDALLSDYQVSVKDKELLKKFQVIQDMEDDTKSMIVKFLDLAIRDFKAKQAYS